MNLTITLTRNEETFLRGYKEALYFTETGEENEPPYGALLDEDFERESAIECLAFFTRAWCFLPTGREAYADAGRNFWFSRNGHGTGFFDSGLKHADHLQKIAETFGEVVPIWDDYTHVPQ